VKAIELDRGEVAEFLATETGFRSLGEQALDDLAAELEPFHVDGGEEIMRQGDPPDAMYLVHRGRLRVLAQDADQLGGHTVLGEVGRGEMVGEMALVSDRPRTATVVALRDGELLRLSTDGFTTLIQEHPAALREITTQVVERALAARLGPRRSPAATLVLVPLSTAAELDDFLSTLIEALGHVVGDVAVVERAEEDEQVLTSRSHELEAESDLVVYRADPEDTPWTRFCLRQADTIVLVGDARARPEPAPVERAVADRTRSVETRVELVLVHPAQADRPMKTSSWLDQRTVARHHHARHGDAAHARRIARLLTGRAIGLVLSGGGARGMSEIGVIRALRERGIPIDAVGGTSAGSMVGGAVARDWDADTLTQILRAGVADRRTPLDLTLPVVAISSARRVTERLRKSAGDLDLEDTWIDFFCVSTNLSRARAQVHRRGPAWRAIRASMSVPGALPPVAEAGDVLVDGGVVENLPVSTMRALHDNIFVIAVDVGVHRELTAGDLPETTVVSGWRVLYERIDPRREAPQLAGLLRVLARLTELGGGQEDIDTGDLLIRPDVEQFPFMDFLRFDELVEAGYRSAVPVLDAWLESEDAPTF
jgi:NTE family protein